jgi:hypothetical protein
VPVASLLNTSVSNLILNNVLWGQKKPKTNKKGFNKFDVRRVNVWGEYNEEIAKGYPCAAFFSPCLKTVSLHASSTQNWKIARLKFLPYSSLK